jgi:RNA polymerase sigma-70 factor (ECF subfamily)
VGDREAAELAFGALVERHGTAVLRACRARLGNEHDAQDACQATFLILARKARSIARQESVASWLHGVARRVASCARRSAALRRTREREAVETRPAFALAPEPSDLAPVVWEEVGSLPEHERTPLTLCLLDGLTHEEAATRLGWPVGTVKTRVRRGKDRLRARLTRRGLAPSLAAIVAAWPMREASAMPSALARAIARAALETPSSQAVTASSVAALVELALRSLMMTRLKLLAVVVASSGIVVAGAARGLARPSPEAAAQAQEPVKPAEPKPVAEVKPPAEPAGAELVDEIELVKLDLQMHTEQANALKTQIVAGAKGISDQQDWLEKVRAADSLQSLNLKPSLMEPDKNPSTAKEIEAESTRSIEYQKKNLAKTRQSYLEAMKQVRADERRIKELEARLTPAGPPIARAPVSGGEDASLDDRIDRWKLENIQAEMLRMEIDRSRERMRATEREFDEIREQARRLERPANMFEDQFKQMAERLDRDQQAARKRIEDARLSFRETSEQLFKKERALRELARGLPAMVQADLARASAGSRTTDGVGPAAESDRRLDQLERKLNQVLEALERRGKE